MFASELEERRKADLYRHRPVVGSPQGPELAIDGKPYLAFCSNDYLGFANHPEVVAAFRKGALQYGVGSGASHLISGHSRAHAALEEELADFTGRERAVLFSTGYMANLGIATALSGRGDEIFQDRLNHASLVDAALLARARLRRYRHADPAALATLLSQARSQRKLLVSDGVFSMDGDCAPLPALASLARRYQAVLVVDDAHGLGVMGCTGGGTLEEFGLEAEAVPVLMGTLGKAFGTFGAFVAGSQPLVELLIQKARSYIYTTALPAAIAEASRVSLRLLQREPWRRQHLHDLVVRFRQGAGLLGLPLVNSVSPIQPLLLGESRTALQASARLKEKGIFIPAIRPPTVPQGSARLRITFSAAHETRHVDRLLEALAELALP
jgi:8-amino-7-oxononanoate synthase